MGREKRTQPGPRGAAKDRHKKAGKVSKPIDRSAPLPPGLVAAKPVKAITNTKHQSYFEFIENKERKKPLLLENTTNTDPPPGMRYIPIGNPELTERCQDISRELGASVYIVTKAKKDASDLSLQIHRVGYHIRENIVDRALAELGLHDVYVPELIGQGDGGLVEKIPDGQDEIDKQADAALRELFPRIPNTDRQQIIDHAFQKGRHFKGDLVVGLQQDLSLSRRVQLAVLAHIRHNHTRYDELLRETSWHNARRATEQLCLDILVKWRGDDENGRNQLDEILREVVVLSDDSDDEESGEEPDSESSEILIDRPHNTGRVSAPAASQNVASHRKRLSTAILSRPGSPVPHATPGTSKRIAKRARKRANHRERNFSRYEAARDAAWDSAMRRQRAPDCRSDQPGMADSSASHGRPAAPIDNRAPVNDDGYPHPQARPLPGQFGNNLYEDRQHMDGAYAARSHPMRSLYLPSSSTMQKVNDTSNTLSRCLMNHGTARSSESHQLQDFLHPSIEPKSPDSIRSPSRYTRGMVEYTDRRGDDLQCRLNSLPRGPVAREDRHLQRPQIQQSYSVHARPSARDQDLVRAPEMPIHRVPHDTTRAAGHQPVRDYGSARPHGYIDRIAHKEEQYGRLDRVLGEKANPIMIEDQTVHPGTAYRTGESVRDRFGPGVEILAVRRPRHDDGPETYRPIPMDEGFIRLREDRPTEQRNGLAEEGFLRLRECPVTRPGPSFGDHRAYGVPQFRPVDIPGQAVYVRRAERAPPAELSYHGPGHGRVEGFRPERVVQGDFLSSADGGMPIEHRQYHPLQGTTYGIPVHRQARPMQRGGDPFRFDQYPPSPPPAQRHWPRADDGVIVLE
ncbi:hypothetical protein CH063_07729 [Colletotrichum higginsianum]|uniref:DUF2293 domain-containing protein n=1 Tax=Colletotrichum higginsianum (strain IMI 349063) TaxID=759273 RepID=H1V783_COLHI|nr:hypothetical protein CH63R_12769 [Colletotrichum higginsianum IMI 349063]OBR03642.1 hypothetical protein CH63R_12769 [Colletotrichum higginsianum IMI 349063]CCF36085.1 hypothetical protein CH063_07729 [Colletotrichum higginsianum]